MKEFIDKLISRLEEREVQAYGYMDGGVTYQAYRNAIEIIIELAEEYKGGWIPCERELPKESLNSVIGWDEYRNRCCFVQYLGGRWVLGNDIDSVKITAWMPLPAPYTEGE